MSTFRQRLMARFINLYPPFVGAGIRSQRLDALTYRIRMRQTIFNGNIFGTHFGGSLYAMCDPWFVLILMQALGPDYIVWDKAARIQFLKPGRGTMTVTFHIPQERVDEIRAALDESQKIEPTFEVDVVDGQGQVIAHVEKLLYVRKKKA